VNEPQAASPADQGGVAGRRTTQVLLAALAVAVVLRVLLNLAASAQLHHPEEFVNLRLAAAVLGSWPSEVALLPEFPPLPPGSEGLERSFFDYQYQEWDGGTLAVSMVLVPLAMLFGLSTVSVKMGALLWCLAGLALWTALLGRLYGGRGLRLSAVCFAAMPVPYLLQSCIHWGNHVESALFPPLGLLALLWASVGADRTVKARRAVVAGLVFGFGTWFSLLNLAPTLLAGALLFLLFRRDTLVVLPAFVLGCVCGVLPWLGRNDLSALGGGLAHGQSLTQVVGAALSYGWDPAALWELFSRYPKFAVWNIHGLWSVPEPLVLPLEVLARLAVAAGAVAALAAAVVALRRGEQSQGTRRLFVLLVVLGSAVALPVLLASQGEHSDRRLGPVYPLLWTLLAAGLVVVASWSRLRWCAWPLLAMLLGSNLVASMAVISSWDRPNAELSPWLHFALPTAEPRERTQVCVPHVAADQVAALNSGLDELFLSSTTGGYDEVRGVCRAFAARGTFLERSYPGCPDRWDVDIMELWLVHSEAEARAVGMGLGIRCAARVEESTAICDQITSRSMPELQSKFRAVCTRAATGD